MPTPSRGRCLCGAVPIGLEPIRRVSFEERVPWLPFHDDWPCYEAKSDNELE